MSGRVDVLIVSLGSTIGLRAADEQLREALERSGASVMLARASAPRPTRTLMLTDLAWARAARDAAQQALRGRAVRAVVYSSTTAALLWPRPGAVRFDAAASGNRPGRHGLWQRPLERRRLAQAPLLLPWSAGALAEAPASARMGDRALVLPVAVEPSAADGRRDIAALTYAANPAKKGLDRVLAAWRRVRAEHGAAADEELLVAGVDEAQLRSAGIALDGAAGVRVLGRLPRADYLALLARARVFVCAPRREDYGIAQLEALAAGCQLVSTPAPGPYAALELARRLDARLIDADLAAALAAALEHPSGDYASRARPLLDGFSGATVQRIVAEQLLPRLLAEAP